MTVLAVSAASRLRIFDPVKAQDARRGPNKITREVKDIAHQYGPGALKELARIATQARARRRAWQPVGKSWTGPTARRYSRSKATVEYGISEQLSELFKENAGNIPAATTLPIRAPTSGPCRITSATEIPSIPPITPVLPGTGLRGCGSRSSHTISRLAG